MKRKLWLGFEHYPVQIQKVLETRGFQLESYGIPNDVLSTEYWCYRHPTLDTRVHFSDGCTDPTPFWHGEMTTVPFEAQACITSDGTRASLNEAGKLAFMLSVLYGARHHPRLTAEFMYQGH